MASPADEIPGLYERHAEAWDRTRAANLTFEREWIDRFTALLPSGGSVIDVGCGSGQPIGCYLVECGFDVIGVDSSPTLISKCRIRFPKAEWIAADMRTLSINRVFDGLSAWNSFFHLSHQDQRAMFTVFREHAAMGAPLLFTTGTEHGEATDSYEGEPLYHASLSSDEYRTLLEAHGFKVLAHVPEDPSCGYHTVWLAQYAASVERT
jgi:cyclopropane fatty-acyl-phospholipid synthase-like methyltransferase